MSPAFVLLRRSVRSGGFGCGDREGVVSEVGDKFQVPAECLDVAGDGLDGGQFAALDLGDPARGDAYGLGAGLLSGHAR